MAKFRIRFSKDTVNDIYQDNLLNYDWGTSIFYGGSASGKSYYIMTKLLLKYLRDIPLDPSAPEGASKERVGLIMMKEQVNLRESLFALMENLLAKFGIIKHCKINKSLLTIELPNKNKFVFRGCQDTNRIKGMANVSDIFIDEIDRIEEEMFELLMTRLRGPVGSKEVYGAFNPVSKASWVYKRFFENGTPEDTLIMKSTYRDNKYVTEAEIKRLEALRATNPIMYNVYANAEFGVVDCDNSIVKYSEMLECINNVDVDNTGALNIGIDVGGTGADSTIFYAFQGLRMVDKVVIKGETTLEIIESKLKELITKFGAGRMTNIKIDASGIGNLVPTHLARVLRGYQNVMIYPINFANRTTDINMYESIIAEMYIKARELIQQKLISVLGGDDELYTEMSSRTFSINPKGQYAIETKKEYKKRMNNGSPDSADAFILALYNPQVVQQPQRKPVKQVRNRFF